VYPFTLQGFLEVFVFVVDLFVSVGLGFQFMALCLSHTSSPLLWLIWGGVSQTISLGWPWNFILPISASKVARITGVSHHTGTQLKISSSIILSYKALQLQQCL
jgi:hypothetical protein